MFAAGVSGYLYRHPIRSDYPQDGHWPRTERRTEANGKRMPSHTHPSRFVGWKTIMYRAVYNVFRRVSNDLLTTQTFIYKNPIKCSVQKV